MSEDLDFVLSGETAAPEPQTENTEEKAQVDEPLKVDEKQEEVTEEVKEKETEAEASKGETTSPKTEKESEAWSFVAYKDEKAKRQALEKRIQELEGSEEKQIRDVFDDQAGFVDDISTTVDSKLLQQKFDITRDLMADSKEDYQEMESKFVEIAKQNPLLAEQAKQHRNPAKFMYDQAKKHQAFEEMQDIDSYKAKIEAELRAKVEADLKAEYEAKADKTSNITPSLANARAADKDSPVEVTLDTLFAS